MANWAQFEEQMVGLPVVARGKNSIHFRGRDGLIEAHFTGKPCHYRDTDGLWKPIDTSLVAKGNGFFGAPHSDVLIHPDGRVVVDGTGYQQITALPGSPTGYVDGDKIVREFSGGRQFLWMKEDGFRQEIILDKLPSLTIKNAQALLASVSGSLPIKYIASQLTAVDAAGNMYRFDNLTNLRTWMTNAVYPVAIDPDFSGSPADGYIIGSGETYTDAGSVMVDWNTSNNNVSIGQYSYSDPVYIRMRAYLKFDTSSIGSSSTVTQANLKLTCISDYSSTDADIYIVKQNWSAYDPISSYADVIFPATGSCPLEDNIWRNTSGISLNTQYFSGNLNTAWVNKTSATYYALCSSRDYNSTSPTFDVNEYIDIASADHTTASYRPVLTVAYSAGGSSGSLRKVFLNGGMQSLCGGMRG